MPAPLFLRRGFNLPEMFLDPGDLRWPDMIRGERGKFRESDFRWIAEWGFNFIRLPLSYRWWADSDDPNRIDEAALAPIDSAMEWARRLGLRLALCLHHAFGVLDSTRPDVTHEIGRDVPLERALLELRQRH